ncbi:MAG: hypothetical protein KDC92_12630 [Bacteroidetes bacterium]|nr:hypothetical protein [Bacteroidota bacterium]
MNKLLIISLFLTLYAFKQPVAITDWECILLENPCDEDLDFLDITIDYTPPEDHPPINISIIGNVGLTFQADGGMWTAMSQNLGTVAISHTFSKIPIPGGMINGEWVSYDPVYTSCCDCICYGLHLFFSGSSWGLKVVDFSEQVPCGGNNGGDPE